MCAHSLSLHHTWRGGFRGGPRFFSRPSPTVSHGSPVAWIGLRKVLTVLLKDFYRFLDGDSLPEGTDGRGSLVFPGAWGRPSQGQVKGARIKKWKSMNSTTSLSLKNKLLLSPLIPYTKEMEKASQNGKGKTAGCIISKLEKFLTKTSDNITTSACRS